VTHAFLSYVRENQKIVDRLAADLNKGGVTVWLDRTQIDPGARWRDAIKSAIKNGQFFIACFSKEYGDRDRTYMNEELTLAIDELRTRSSNTSWFIPVLLNDTTIPSIRISSVEQLDDFQAIRLYENWGEGVARILRVMRRNDLALARVWALLDMAIGPFEAERLHAIEELGRIGPVENVTLTAPAKIVAENTGPIKAAALAALANVGPPAAVVVSEIVAALQDTDDKVRGCAAAALQKVGVVDPEIAQKLVALLKDDSGEVRQNAAAALNKIGFPTAADIPALAHALKDANHDEWELKCAIMDTLGKMGAAAVEAVPVLILTLRKGGHWALRVHAAEALGRIGPGAVDAVPFLAAVALREDDIEMILDWFDALNKIRGFPADYYPSNQELRALLGMNGDSAETRKGVP
jgi:HEAT repeat protein